jgi:hypothetical protein
MGAFNLNNGGLAGRRTVLRQGVDQVAAVRCSSSALSQHPGIFMILSKCLLNIDTY